MGENLGRETEAPTHLGMLYSTHWRRSWEEAPAPPTPAGSDSQYFFRVSSMACLQMESSQQSWTRIPKQAPIPSAEPSLPGCPLPCLPSGPGHLRCAAVASSFVANVPGFSRWMFLRYSKNLCWFCLSSLPRCVLLIGSHCRSPLVNTFLWGSTSF